MHEETKSTESLSNLSEATQLVSSGAEISNQPALGATLLLATSTALRRSSTGNDISSSLLGEY